MLSKALRSCLTDSPRSGTDPPGHGGRNDVARNAPIPVAPKRREYSTRFARLATHGSRLRPPQRVGRHPSGPSSQTTPSSKYSFFQMGARALT